MAFSFLGFSVFFLIRFPREQKQTMSFIFQSCRHLHKHLLRVIYCPTVGTSVRTTVRFWMAMLSLGWFAWWLIVMSLNMCVYFTKPCINKTQTLHWCSYTYTYLNTQVRKRTVHSSLILAQVDCSLGGMWFHFPFFKATPRFAFPLSPVPLPVLIVYPKPPSWRLTAFTCETPCVSVGLNGTTGLSDDRCVDVRVTCMWWQVLMPDVSLYHR